MADRVKSVKAWAIVDQGEIMPGWISAKKQDAKRALEDDFIPWDERTTIIPVEIHPLPAKKKAKVKHGK